jgi:hypothetical protein
MFSREKWGSGEKTHVFLKVTEYLGLPLTWYFVYVSKMENSTKDSPFDFLNTLVPWFPLACMSVHQFSFNSPYRFYSKSSKSQASVSPALSTS